MPVIDVDSHLQGPFTWFEQDFPELAAQLPTIPADMMIGALVGALSGEALSTLPPELRPADMMELVPDLWKPLAEQFASKSSLAEIDEMIYGTDTPLGAGPLAPRLDRLFRVKGGWNMDDRVGFLDEAGIDVQLVSGNSAPVYPGIDTALAQQCIAAANQLMINRIGPHIDRIVPIAYVMMEDLDWSIAEMTRMRSLGSRAVHIRATPVDGMSLAHPHFDRFWAAVTDLGMIAYLHAGSGRAFVDPAWANNGGVFSSVTMMGASQYQQVPTMLCGALVTGGVFERFPTLTVVNAELGGHIWVPNFLGWMDAFVDDPKISSLQCRFEYPLKPSEYARRNVRVSPLPVMSMPVRDYLEDLDGMLVFSSDYPHPEGLDDDAVAWYRDHFGNIDAAVQERFFSGSMAEVFDRMGDPLPIPSRVG